MNPELSQSIEESSSRFVHWMHESVVSEGRGDAFDTLATEPRGTLWLGRLAPESAVANNPLGKRAEKLDPCAIGVRFSPELAGPWVAQVSVSFVCWSKSAKGQYVKSKVISFTGSVPIDPNEARSGHFERELSAQLAELGLAGRKAEVRVEVEAWRAKPELVVMLVNTGDEATNENSDTHLYEAVLTVTGILSIPFVLESLPDSFRYDRQIPAIGINCGLVAVAGGYQTSDVTEGTKFRPRYWTVDSPEPDLSFTRLASDPIPPLEELLAALQAWGQLHWSRDHLASLSSSWSDEMKAEAERSVAEFELEVTRISEGVELMRSNLTLCRAFMCANEAMAHAANGRYGGWRAFQVGFLIGSLAGIVEPADANVVDTVWFATGGGKTETYLGLLVTSILFDRMTGKREGISAWSRFPLRMLSLQQTQRFADALAGAELARLAHGIQGSPIALGFFVGDSSTPNRIDNDPEYGKPDPLDPHMPQRFQVLLRCPFCRNEHLDMGFDRATWRLEHRCANSDCPWPERALPFYVVDQEIYRFLPSVVVGTLDKAAMVGMQAAMRGFFGAPLGQCNKPGHGYCYSPRSATPSGCLVPGCRGSRVAVSQPADRWAPTLRLQDELHLLRDSLGAVDSHYESLLDHLQTALSGRRAKVIASSATLTGFERQVDVLYQRSARVFPQPGPSVDESFWSSPTDAVARRYVAIAPRGVTMEFVKDRILSILQERVREFLAAPQEVGATLGIPVAHSDRLVSNYGVNVVYGNTVRDVEAARRSADTEFPFAVNAETLVGGSNFEDVRTTLDRLDNPEAMFEDRIHVIAASSMISHGVDVDRLNTMVMLGLPLTTSEFIQTTARVGRKWPGIVYVIHRLTREREAGTFAQFERFVSQGDRFIEPIPITRASRRVLALTATGLVEARRLAIHEPASHGALTTVRKLREYYHSAGIDAASEEQELVAALGIAGPLDEHLRQDLASWLSSYFSALNDPATQVKWPSELSPSGPPMRSLREVEEAVPITGEG
jgi:hypothetical protein